MNNKTFYIVLSILLVIASISLASYLPARSDVALKIKVTDFPLKIGEWQGKDIPIPERDYEILETRNLFVREYKNRKNESVYLYLIYSEDNRKVSHPPEVCFLGSGMTITDKSPIKILNSINAIKMLVEKQNVREMVVYWFKAGRLYTDNYLKQQIKIVIDRIFGKRTAGALIRLSAVIKDDDTEGAVRLITSFTESFTPLLAKYVP
jgi:EpsI family protein